MSSDKTAFCGTLGQPMLYVPLSGSRVLTRRARRARWRSEFAASAVQRLQRLTKRRPAVGSPCTRSPTPTALLRAHRRLLVRERTGGAAVPAHRLPARPHQPVHRHLLGDGGHHPAAVPGLRRRLLAAGLRGHRRHLQRRDGDPGRLASGFIGDRWRRHKEVATAGYGLSAVCKLLLAIVGTALSAIGAIVLHRPRRQGHPHGSARRDDLAVDAASASSAPRSGCTARWTRPGAMIGPLLAFAHAGASRRSPSTRSSSSASSSRSSGSGILVLLVQPQARRATPPTRRAPAPSLRGAPAPARSSRATARCWSPAAC